MLHGVLVNLEAFFSDLAAHPSPLSDGGALEVASSPAIGETVRIEPQRFNPLFNVLPFFYFKE